MRMKIPYFCAIKRSHRSQATAQASVGMTWLLRAPASVGMTWLLQAINNNAAAVVRQPYKSRQHELNPESWTKNFRGFIMRKKHDYEARLKYMKMLEEGHSVSSISRQYGIDHRILSTLWMRYKEEGPVALVKKKNCTFTVAEKIAVISEYREKHLSLPDIMLSHGVSRSAIKGWCRRYAAGGEEALVDRPRGRRREDMGRPKKKTSLLMARARCRFWM